MSRTYPCCLLLLAISACGPGGSGGSGGSGNEDYDTFIEASCDWSRGCCERAGMSIEALVDCEAQAQTGQLSRSVQSGKLELIEPLLSECIATLRTLASTCDLSDESQVCGMFFRGTVPTGGACDDTFECARTSDPVTCLPSTSSDDAPGVCRTLRRASTGEPCILTSDDATYGLWHGSGLSVADAELAHCDQREGLYCSFPERICKPDIAEGGACVDLGCKAGLYCDGTCQPYRQLGDPCTSDLDCIGHRLMCTSGVCTQISFADADFCAG